MFRSTRRRKWDECSLRLGLVTPRYEWFGETTQFWSPVIESRVFSSAKVALQMVCEEPYAPTP